MATSVTENIALRMSIIETRRLQTEKEMGADVASTEALSELHEMLAVEQQALQQHPYGRGHAWNEWAIQVVIEQLNSKAKRRRGR